MNPSAWIARKRITTEGTGEKVQYSNTVVQCPINRGAAGCGQIIYSQITYVPFRCKIRHVCSSLKTN
jgi:hypothetical protein